MDKKRITKPCLRCGRLRHRNMICEWGMSLKPGSINYMTPYGDIYHIRGAIKFKGIGRYFRINHAA